MSAPRPGFFVAFEGGEGAGKSTQARLLAGWLREQGRPVVLTREPGDSPIGPAVRALLLDPATAGLSARAEALLYAADRAEHVASVVRPALLGGAVVVSDRYADSSTAYQGAGRGLGVDAIARLSSWATGGLVPDLTVLLDVDPSVGLRRPTGPADRLEREPPDFHRRVRDAFRQIAAANPGRYLVLDATRSPERTAADVRERLTGLLPAPPPAPVGRSR